MLLEKFIAFRYLRSRRKEKAMSVITVIATTGVALGVAALIVVLSIMNGFEQELKAALIGANAHLTINNFTNQPASQSFSAEVIEKITTVDNVQRYSPFVIKQALLVGKNKSSGALIKGIIVDNELDNSDFIRSFIDDDDSKSLKDEARLSSGQTILKNLSQTHLYDKPYDNQGPQNLDAILIGSVLARNLGVTVGDTLLLIPPEGRISPFGTLPRGKKLLVRGLYQSGLSGYDETLAFIRIDLAQKIFKQQNKYSGVAVYIDDPYIAEQTKTQLAAKLPFPYIIRTWIDDNRNIFTVLLIEKYSLAIILILVIIIASFNIIGSLVMLVQEKRRDISILKALGAYDSAILKIFMLQGMVIGTVGTVIGFFIGLLICWFLQNFEVINIPAGVYVNNKIPMQMQWWQIVLILGLSVLICFLVTLLPARRAARTSPVDVLRYE